MNNKWKEIFFIHSRTLEFKEKVNVAKEIIRNIFQKHYKPYAAFSGGKDSTCMTYLVLQENPDVMVLHWDFGRYYIPDEIHQEIKKNAKKLEVRNLRIETSKEYEILKRKAVNVLGRNLIEGLIPRLRNEGYDASFIGLRMEESYKRKRRIKTNRSLTKIPEFFPLKNWTWMDIWAYIVKNNLPYSSHYDLYAPIIGWDKARFTTFFDPEFNKYGCQNIDNFLMWRYKNA
ncbi:MAG: phosphoadenosine phosphosulfate reductase family protein [Promethearchaeota archaeon]